MLFFKCLLSATLWELLKCSWKTMLSISLGGAFLLKNWDMTFYSRKCIVLWMSLWEIRSHGLKQYTFNCCCLSSNCENFCHGCVSLSIEPIEPTVTEVTINATDFCCLMALKSTRFWYWQPCLLPLNNENAPEATKSKKLIIAGKKVNTK